MPGLSQTVLLTPLLPFSFETPDKVELCVGPGQQLDRRKCSGCTDPAPAKRGLPSEQQWHGLEARLVDPPRGRTEPVHVAAAVVRGTRPGHLNGLTRPPDSAGRGRSQSHLLESDQSTGWRSLRCPSETPKKRFFLLKR